MTSSLMRLCSRVVLALEGGYNVNVSAECAAHCVAVCPAVAKVLHRQLTRVKATKRGHITSRFLLRSCRNLEFKGVINSGV